MAAFYDSPAFGGPIRAETTEINGIRVSRADRGPCPVCGHPTGDCSGDGDAGPKTIWGYNTNSSLDDKLTFYLEEDYVEERTIAPGITTRVVLYKAGQHIPLKKAKELGFIN